MYLITGTTGNVGSEVVAQLLDSGQMVRVFTRNPDKVAHWGKRIQVAIGDFAQPDAFARAAAGVEGIFLMNGGPDAESVRQLLEAAKTQGSPSIVFLSTMLASIPEEFQIGKLHKDKEDAIRASDLQATFIRPVGFMTNTYQWLDTIKAESVAYNPMGAGKSAPIAPEDIAAVVIRALTDPKFSGKTLEVTGSELLNTADQVNILAQILDRPLRCVDVPIEFAIQGFMRAGVPAPIAAAIGQSFEAVRDGRTATIKDTVKQVTGNQPKTFEAWAREHAARFV
ncbi:MAG: NAD(P)H-binding protein [Chloroflexi bacterium]|nr:NAD(P)H-binding protein [Chloroflexota bacterium]